MQQSFRAAAPDEVLLSGEAAAPAAGVDADEIAVSVHRDLAEIEPVWRAFEEQAIRPIYQRFDWLAPWCEHAAPPLGIEPAVVLGRRGGRPVFLLPLGRRNGPLGRAVGWLGGSHVNSGLGLFDQAFADTLDAPATNALFRRVLDALAPVDYAALCCQPFAWGDMENPLRFLDGHVEDQPILAIPLEADFDALLRRQSGARKRKKMRWQENTLAPVGGYRFRRAESREEAFRFLEAFLAHKTAQFARSGIDNVFAEPGIADFLRALVERSLNTGDSLIELYAVEIDGAIRATFGGGVDRGRFQGYFSAIAIDDYQRVSPGELLLFNLMRACCQRGLSVFDLGIGEERYKFSWEAEPQPQFASYVGATWRGRIVATALRQIQAFRIKVRSNPNAWRLVKTVRRRLAAVRTRVG